MFERAVAKFKSLDAFPKAVNDVTERSRSSGLISIFAMLLIFWMVVSEFKGYRRSELHHGLGVDNDRTAEQDIEITVNILVATKCEYLSADVVDVSGAHYGSEITHTLTKTPAAWVAAVDNEEQVDNWWKEPGSTPGVFSGLRMTDILKKGHRKFAKDFSRVAAAGGRLDALKGIKQHLRDAPTQGRQEPLKLVPLETNNTEFYNKSQNLPEPTEAELKYGLNACRISGKLYVAKVKTNFHITAGSTIEDRHGGHRHDLSSVPPGAVNFTHHVHKMAFGTPFPRAVSPLDGVVQHTSNAKSMYNYFMRIVPTRFEDETRVLETNQYSVTYAKRDLNPTTNTHGLPGIFFTFEFDAIAVTITERTGSFFHFLVQLCAIVGGVFAVSGIAAASVRMVPAAVTAKRRPQAMHPFND